MKNITSTLFLTSKIKKWQIIKLFFIAEGKYLPNFAQILIFHEFSQPKPHDEGSGVAN